MLNNFSHKYIKITESKFTDSSKNLYKVTLKQYSKSWSKFLDDSLEYSDELKCWFINDKDIKEFIELVENADYNDKKRRKDESYTSENDSHSATESGSATEDSEESSEDESDMDDEMIQKALARRLTSESKMMEDNREYISDSEMEDMISLCRRIRFLYKLVKDLSLRIKDLEQSR